MAAATSPLITFLDPPSLGPPHPVFCSLSVIPLSDSVNQVNISGQVAQTPTGDVPEGLGPQMHVILSRITTCLEAVGATVHDISVFKYYFTEKARDREDFLPFITDIMLPWLQGSRPASSALIVKALSQPEFLCEFEAQVVVRAKAAGSAS
ncbi:hypothetical protein BDY17DRAFT_323364 [Neohortaea acidophila]|uniref:Uncharacterized protein n=1 Tax=Neohortaea acidophila TaxID=245834 RepID=A0A6A6PXT6_9PEZI|nr:uncharacterized protein BDY17DRAFT_323364 [Neohortaea acidophila]KAF2484519.1 hypothetical protein BDY17DRAFT_323364 [Neohortaea acidophila]